MLRPQKGNLEISFNDTVLNFGLCGGGGKLTPPLYFIIVIQIYNIWYYFATKSVRFKYPKVLT